MNKKIWISCLKATLFSLILFLALLFLLAFAAYRQSDPDSLLPLFGFLLLFLPAFAGGFASAKIHREEGMKCGLVTGFLLLLPILLLSSVLSHDGVGIGLWQSVVSYLALLLLAMLGGIVGVRGKRGDKKRKKKKNAKTAR